MKIREFSVRTIYNHEYQKAFNSSTWCIREMYWYGLRKFKEAPYAKVVVTLGEEKPIEVHGKVYNAYKPFDFEKYFALEDAKKKKVILDILHTELMYIFNEEGLDTSILIQSYNSCIQRSLLNKWLLKEKYFSSKDRKYKGAVECVWELDSFVATGIILDQKKQELARKVLVEVEPYMGDFIYWAKCGWEADSFYLESKKGERWKIGLNLI